MLRWKTLKSELILDRSPWLRVHSDEVELPDGRIVGGYLRLETPDFAVVVPVATDGRLGMIRSYKRGPDDIDLHPPAGMIEPEEEPLQAAQRELLEETGYQASRWLSMGRYVLAGNLRGGYAYLYLATGCRKITAPDSGDLEEQQVLWLEREEVERLWRRGGFAQLGSAAALGLAFAQLDAVSS